MNQSNRRTSTWTADEDSKLKDTLERLGRNSWGAIAALVPGRTGRQCRDRWTNALAPSIDGASGRTGKWLKDEDIKLKDAVQTHGGKHWGAIAALVPGRSEKRCWGRWHYFLNPSISKANEWVNGEKMKTSS
jgi:myb proto-oncogene protein